MTLKSETQVVHHGGLTYVRGILVFVTGEYFYDGPDDFLTSRSYPPDKFGSMGDIISGGGYLVA